MELNLINILISLAMLVITGFSAHFWWTYRKVVNRVEQTISKVDVEKLIAKLKQEHEKAVIEAREEAKESIKRESLALQKELAVVKEDTRSMADSVLKSIKGLEDRFDALMLHLLNKGK